MAVAKDSSHGSYKYEHPWQRLLRNNDGRGSYSTSLAGNPTKQKRPRHLSNTIGRGTYKTTMYAAPTHHHWQWPLTINNGRSYYTTLTALLRDIIGRDIRHGTYRTMQNRNGRSTYAISLTVFHM